MIIGLRMSDFVKFLADGTAVDLAIGTMMGASFSGIIDSLVNDVSSPLLGLVTPSYSTSFLVLKPGPHAPYKTKDSAQKDGAVILSYGTFLQTCVLFLMKGVCLYIIVHILARMRRDLQG